MEQEDKIKKETIKDIREYILSRKNLDSRNTWMGDRNYSLRELLEQVEKQTSDGIRFAQMYERHQETRKST